jgi:WD40 repeat protein
MASHNSVVSSGGDHGCCSLILWDIKTWTIKNKIQVHTAAVTCIVDLCDGQTLATGSYDKKICFYNYKRSTILHNLSANKVAVACMTLNGDKSRLISSGLDNSITVWKIYRDEVLFSLFSMEISTIVIFKSK